MSDGVLVIGESILDVIHDGRDVREHAGGSPLNVACGLSRLGHNVRFLSSVGRDRGGRVIQAHLAESGVRLVEESIGAGETSTAVATIEPDGSATYKFDIAWSMPAAKSLGPTDWVHTGSLATFLKPGADSVEQFLRSLSTRSVISYDPNIRPQLLLNHTAAVSQFERFVALADVVKLSDEDALWLYPDLDETAVLARILELGASVAAFTRGAQGARIVTAHYSVEAPILQVDVVDTIGAGDTFMAALISDLHGRELPPAQEALHTAAIRAATAAALTCARAGAVSPTLRELKDAVL